MKVNLIEHVDLKTSTCVRFLPGAHRNDAPTLGGQEHSGGTGMRGLFTTARAPRGRRNPNRNANLAAS